jgi:hypothetical protein
MTRFETRFRDSWALRAQRNHRTSANGLAAPLVGPASPPLGPAAPPCRLAMLPCGRAERYLCLFRPLGEIGFSQFRSCGRPCETPWRQRSSESPPWDVAERKLRPPFPPSDTPLPPFDVAMRKWDPNFPPCRLVEPHVESAFRRDGSKRRPTCRWGRPTGSMRGKSVPTFLSAKLTCLPTVPHGRPATPKVPPDKPSCRIPKLHAGACAPAAPFARPRRTRTVLSTKPSTLGSPPEPQGAGLRARSIWK